MDVLIAEDSEIMLSVVEKMLKFSSVDIQKIFKSTNVDDAINVLKNNKIDLLITDLKMPNSSGKELILKAKSIEHCRDMKIIVMSGALEKEILQQLKETGMDGYLKKPFTPSVLTKTISDLFST